VPFTLSILFRAAFRVDQLPPPLSRRRTSKLYIFCRGKLSRLPRYPLDFSILLLLALPVDYNKFLRGPQGCGPVRGPLTTPRAPKRAMALLRLPPDGSSPPYPFALESIARFRARPSTERQKLFLRSSQFGSTTSRFPSTRVLPYPSALLLFISLLFPTEPGGLTFFFHLACHRSLPWFLIYAFSRAFFYADC